jgi:2-hydroxy-3-oxopropionate reductase
MHKKIGFVGLGLMGSRMAHNLIAAGFELIVHDLDPDNIQAIVAAGGRQVVDPADLAKSVDTIILSLPNSNIVNDVVENSLRLPDTGREGLILIDTTTADPVMSEALAQQLRLSGIEMLDATISGTPEMCAAREITMMIGGSETIYRSCKPIFSAMAAQLYYTGKNGSGALTKLIVNLVLGLNRMVLAEGLSLGKQAGMDQQRLLEILKGSAAYSKAMDMKGDRMVKRKLEPASGKLAFHLKDVRLMLDLAERLNFPLPLTSLHAQVLTDLTDKGRGEWDNASIISHYDNLMER